jgi:hypothetical protein
MLTNTNDSEVDKTSKNLKNMIITNINQVKESTKMPV